jgi:hypothetical protein
MACKEQMKAKKTIQLPSWIIPVVCSLLILGIVFNIGSVVFQQHTKYLAQDYWKRYPALKQIYADSQYANKNVKSFVPDEVVYAYAGGAFIQGAHPLLIIPDAPPLGKYLIGISVLLFQNEHTIMIIAAVLSLVLFYFLAKQILSSTLLALIPVFLYSSEALFKNQLVYTPLFDLMQLVFLLGSFLAFNRGLFSKKRHTIFFALACALLGFFISTKFFVSGITIIAAWYIVLFIRRDKKRLLSLTAVLPLVPVILLATYSRVFAFGYSLRDLIGAQKWIFIYHQGQLIKPFSIWPLLMLNQWYVWWGDKPVLSDSQWTILWPIITLCSAATIILYILKKIPKKAEIEVLMIWAICYLLFFSIGQITVRYFIILLPILYILTMFGISMIVKKHYLHQNK